MKKMVLLIALISVLLLPLAAGNGDFNFDLDFGIEYTTTDEGVPRIELNLQPDIAIGKFGVGLNGMLNIDVVSDGTLPVTFNFDNWIPDFSGDTTIMDYVSTAAGVYLPIFEYVRYGYKGDPLHIKFGQLDEVTVGTGMFMRNYSNMQYLPDQTILGGILDMDGRLFNFPYVGFEAITGNLAEFDVITGRLYVRPLAFVNFPIIKDIQLGGSMAVDQKPDQFDEFAVAPNMVSMYGADIMMPILDTSLFELTLFGDAGFQPARDGSDTTAVGYRAGLDGHILGFLTYNADLLFPSNGFVPGYFDRTYDLEREERYLSTGISSTNYFLNAGAGFNLFDSALVFDLDVASEITDNAGTFTVIDPTMTASFSLGEDFLKFFYFDAAFRKNFGGNTLSIEEFANNVFSLSNSRIEAQIYIEYSVFVFDTGVTVEFDETGTMGEPQIGLGATFELL